MVKSETRRDAEILVRNPSPRLFGKKFRDSNGVRTQTGFMYVDFALSKVCFTDYMHLDTALDYEL